MGWAWKDYFRVITMFCIFIIVLVACVYTFVKTHRSVHVKWVIFTICKLYPSIWLIQKIFTSKHMQTYINTCMNAYIHTYIKRQWLILCLLKNVSQKNILWYGWQSDLETIYQLGICWLANEWLYHFHFILLPFLIISHCRSIV